MDTLLSDPRFYQLYAEAKAKRLEQFGEEDDHLTVALNPDIHDLMSALAAAEHITLADTVKAFIMGGVERVIGKPERRL